MNRFAKTMLGVTLLEIMLVLAIAAMIVVLSIRYYQSAQTSQQANQALSQVQAAMAAMDNLGMAGGYGKATADDISAIVGANNMVTPTGGTITLPAKTDTTYTLSVPLSPALCTNLAAKLSNTTANPKITGAGCGGDGKTLTFTYDSTL